MKFTHVIGIDVASEKLDIFDALLGKASVIANGPRELRAFIKGICDPQQTLVICEATGAYEHYLVDALHEANIHVCVANPRQVRDFAKGHGFLEKTDRIDARMIAVFGQQVDVNLTQPRSDAEKKLIALVRRRSQLLQLLGQENNRLRLCFEGEVRQLLRKSISYLEKQQKQLDARIETALKEFGKADPRIDVIASMPGVGVVTTATVICELPEIGKLSRTEISKLVGVAPLAKQSGKSEGKRPVRGGRSQVRKVLYMASLVATQRNPTIKAFYRRLLKRGKPKKLALVACMRKLITILNDMVRHKQAWIDPTTAQQEKRAAVPSLN